MLFLFLAKYLFYLWIIIFILLAIFDEKGKYSVNKVFLYTVGVFLWIIHEIYTYINGGYSILGFLGLFLNLSMIFVGVVMIRDKDKEERNFGYIWILIWSLILIYILK